MSRSQPPDQPRAYLAAFVGLLGTAVEFPDGFLLLLATAAGVPVVAATVLCSPTSTSGGPRR